MELLSSKVLLTYKFNPSTVFQADFLISSAIKIISKVSWTLFREWFKKGEGDHMEAVDPTITS